jgi:hypothetical protein
MRLPKTALAAAAGALLMASGCRTMPNVSTPSLEVFNQRPFHRTVVVQEAVSPGPGWIVIQDQWNGRPARVMGFAPVKAGVNRWVRITLDRTFGSSIVYASLVTDGGKLGRFEYPGTDTLVTADGRGVTELFRLLTTPVFPARMRTER